VGLNAGTLNARVVIQQRASGQDAVGQPSATWSTLATVWANVRHPTGNEAMRADKDISINAVRVRIRRRTDVTPAMRLTHGSATYQIKAVLPDTQRLEFTDLLCELING
jgi:SPP1 family predicted phage head-tail adaptor